MPPSVQTDRGGGYGALTEGSSMRLEIDAVSKRYGDLWGLSDFSLSVENGLLGLLGPNGAGKSTLMRILATVTRPTTGRVCFNEHDVVAQPDPVRRVVGYLPQDFGVYPNLNAVQFLHYLAAAKGIARRSATERIERLLELTNLTGASRRALGGFSGGMRQRVGIAQALLNDPQLLIVDEPTAGLDPEERVRFRNLLADLAGDRIVILSTHIVSDVEATAGQIALIDHGRLVTLATPEELLQRGSGRSWEWVIPASDLARVRSTHMVTGTTRKEDGVHLRIVAEAPPSDDAVQVPPTLEDVYLHVVAAHRGRAAA
jgi:ABC-2 type transport system ATP-binding protein